MSNLHKFSIQNELKKKPFSLNRIARFVKSFQLSQTRINSVEEMKLKAYFKGENKTKYLSNVVPEIRNSWFKGELNPKIDFLSFEHLGIVEQLYGFFYAVSREQFRKI